MHRQRCPKFDGRIDDGSGNQVQTDPNFSTLAHRLYKVWKKIPRIMRHGLQSSSLRARFKLRLMWLARDGWVLADDAMCQLRLNMSSHKTQCVTKRLKYSISKLILSRVSPSYETARR